MTSLALPPPTKRRLEEIAVRQQALIAELKRRREEEKKAELAAKGAHHFRVNCADWIESFCWILDEHGDEKPFRLYGYQRRFVDEVVRVDESGLDIDNALNEKSRQMGFSWLYMAIELWALTYWKTFRVKNISRKQDEVDDGGEASSTDSLHGKIRFMWERLPDGLKAPLLFRTLRISRKDAPGFIVGESANPNAGRGGTYDMVLLDEAAFIPFSEQIVAAVTQACKRGVQLNSTPNGKAGAFGRLRHAAQSVFKVLTNHWTEHPVFSKGLYYDEEQRPRSPWYDAQCEKMLPEDVARELDIDYEGSVLAKVFPEAGKGMHVCKVGYDANLPLQLWWDFGMADPTSVMFVQIYIAGKLPEVRVIADYEETDLVPAEHAENIRAILRKIGFRGDTRSIRCYGDPAANSRSLQKKTTLTQDYAKEGLVIRSRRSSIVEGIKLCKMLLRGQSGTLHVDHGCELFQLHLHENRYPTDRQGNRKAGVEEPLNDAHNHMCAGFRYGMVNNFRSTASAGAAPRAGRR